MMAEVCPDCGLPYAVQLSPSSATPGCMTNLPPSRHFSDERLLACAIRTVTRLRSQLAAAHACIEAADKMRPWSAASDNCDEAYDAARAEYERVTKGHHERGI